ncbi:imidazole glycerol phosphate synthase subunit HisH [Bartonella sp. DGB2]|uniref:imidazole glycerol phosphate synthase subunit HisH n=1 Tax=Bartonella sp. DGB2 TaxID=3388426 RepID=UPI00399021E3
MKITIIDTGLANLYSLKIALNRLGVEPTISADAKDILNADRLFLPGVGAAGPAMATLKSRGLAELIPQCKQPLLGICLGMQLLGQKSSESGGTPLLNIIDVACEKLTAQPPLTLPHMGWNRVNLHAASPLFRGIIAETHFYFVHSFHFALNPYMIASTSHGVPFCAAIARDNFYGVQFHPERSGKAGAQLLENFLEAL